MQCDVIPSTFRSPSTLSAIRFVDYPSYYEMYGAGNANLGRSLSIHQYDCLLALADDVGCRSCP